MQSVVESNELFLPEPKKAGTISVEEAIKERYSIRVFQSFPLNLVDLAQLLWAAQGITHAHELRAAPSAGALYPLEVYVLASNVGGLTAGVYKYNCKNHSLKQILSEDKRQILYEIACNQTCIKCAPAVLVIVAVSTRTRKKYGDRTARYVAMEVGCVAQNIYLQATALKLGTVFIGAFNDEEVARVIGMQPQEEALCLMPVGKV